MKFSMLRSYISKTLSIFIFLTLFASFTLAQSINGIYGDGSVSLHLEEVEEGVIGLFADTDGSYYEAIFINDEEFNYWFFILTGIKVL